MAQSGSRLRENVIFFLIFLLFSCLYFYRIFTEGIIVAPGDAHTQNYPLREFYSQSLKGFKTLPLWSPHEFAGIPYIGAMQTGGLYPPNILLYFLLSAPYAFNLSFLLHYAMAGFFTYIYLRELGLGRVSSFTGGVVFGFSGFLASHKPHTAIVNAAVWLPLIVYLYEKLRKSLDPKYMLLASLAIAVQVTAGNFQICLYTYIVIAVFVVVYLSGMEKGRRLRLVILGLCAVFLGLVISSPHLYAVKEFSDISLRKALREASGYGYFSKYHVYATMLPSFFFPYIFGNGDYGPQGNLGPADGVVPFVGMLTILLSLVVVFKGFLRAPHIRFWAVVGAIGLFLSFGAENPLYKIFYHVPVLNLFRAPARNLLEFTLATSVLMALGLDHIFSNGEKAGGHRGHLSALIIMLGISVSLAFVLVLIAGAVEPDPLIVYLKGAGHIDPETSINSINFQNPAIFIPLLFMCAYFLWAFFSLWKNPPFLKYAVMALVLVEAFSFGAFNEVQGPKIDNIRDSYGLSLVYDHVRGSGLNRIMKLPSSISGHSLSHVPEGIGSINSYNQLSVRDYSMLLGLNPEGVMPVSEEALQWLLGTNRLLSALNVKYIVVSSGIEIKGIEANFYEKVMNAGAYDLYLNKSALPRAYLVRKLIPVKDIQAVREVFSLPGFEPGIEAAVFDKDYASIGRKDFSGGDARIVHHGIHKVVVRTKTEGRGFLVLSEQFYPGWKAFVDGTESLIYPANGVLRGVVVPSSGEHEVTFRYLPYKFFFLMGLSALLIIGIFSYIAYKSIK